MLKYPTVIIDDFFDDPYEVREFALGLSYVKTANGHWPGKRTDHLNNIDIDFFNMFASKCIPYAIAGRENLTIEFECYFQIIDRYSDSPDDLVNRGFIHRDDDRFSFAGIVYLNEDISKHCGTSIFRLKDDTIFESSVKVPLYKDGIKVDEFDEHMSKHLSQFEETVSADNYFNRLVMFDSQQYHGVKNFHTGTDEPRLTLVFFAKEVS